MEVIEEALQYGSIFHILSTITCEDILAFLTTHIDEQYAPAYWAACQLTPPTLHYFQDRHFLSYVKDQPIYGILYLLANGDLDIPIEKNGDNPLSTLLGKAIKLFHCDATTRNTYLPLQTLKIEKPWTKEKVRFVFMFGLHSLYPEAVKHAPLELLLRYDTFDYFTTLPMTALVQRGEQLQRLAPAYWSCVQSRYESLFIQRWQNTPELLPRLVLICPSIVPGEIQHLSAEALNLYVLPLTLTAYILGFDLTLSLPLENEIARALQAYSRCPDIQCEISVSPLVNESDTLDEKITSYNPVDVIYYAEDKHYYAFTRPEFEYLKREKKNPYTRRQLRDELFFRIEQRLALIRYYQLPPALPCTQLARTYSIPLPQRITKHFQSTFSALPSLATAD